MGHSEVQTRTLQRSSSCLFFRRCVPGCNFVHQKITKYCGKPAPVTVVNHFKSTWHWWQTKRQIPEVSFFLKMGALPFIFYKTRISFTKKYRFRNRKKKSYMPYPICPNFGQKYAYSIYWNLQICILRITAEYGLGLNFIILCYTKAT